MGFVWIGYSMNKDAETRNNVVRVQTSMQPPSNQAEDTGRERPSSEPCKPRITETRSEFHPVAPCSLETNAWKDDWIYNSESTGQWLSAVWS